MLSNRKLFYFFILTILFINKNIFCVSGATQPGQPASDLTQQYKGDPYAVEKMIVGPIFNGTDKQSLINAFNRVTFNGQPVISSSFLSTADSIEYWNKPHPEPDHSNNIVWRFDKIYNVINTNKDSLKKVFCDQVLNPGNVNPSQLRPDYTCLLANYCPKLPIFSAAGSVVCAIFYGRPIKDLNSIWPGIAPNNDNIVRIIVDNRPHWVDLTNPPAPNNPDHTIDIVNRFDVVMRATNNDQNIKNLFCSQALNPGNIDLTQFKSSKPIYSQILSYYCPSIPIQCQQYDHEACSSGFPCCSQICSSGVCHGRA